MQSIKMRSYWNRVGLNPVTSVLLRRGKFGHSPRQMRLTPHKDRADIGVMYLQAKDCEGLLAITRARREAWDPALLTP